MTDHLKIAFMGTAGFAVPSLKRLAGSKHDILLVITQPDRKKGRGRIPAVTPVKEEAQKSGLDLFQPENVNTEEGVARISELHPDVIVVVAYGQILKKPLLDIPAIGCINIHASLLPALRGAAPINRAIVNGEQKTGVTTMFMDEGMDTGDILLQMETDIDDVIDSLALTEKLSVMGADVLMRTLENAMGNKLERIRQAGSEATYAPPLKKSDGLISFSGMDARHIHNMVRGLLPWPGAHTDYDGKSVKILKTAFHDDEYAGAPPGTVVNVNKESFYVKAKKGVLEVFSLQPENKKTMSAHDFINGYRLSEGAVIGGAGERIK